MRIRLAVLAGAALAGALIAPAAVRADVSTQIIGGDTVSSAPWSAQIIRSNGSFTCSGSIIASRWVLTAAHCTSNGMSVRVGSVNRGSGTLARVTRFNTRNDLALLFLDRTINTTFVSLASSNPPVGATNSIYGWGMTCRSGCSASSVLKTATVRVTTTNARDAFGGQAIGSTRINGNAWRGDSGGPQFYQNRQVGVASTADGVSRQFYGSVPFNRSWIRSTSASSVPPAAARMVSHPRRSCLSGYAVVAGGAGGIVGGVIATVGGADASAFSAGMRIHRIG